MVKVKNKPKPKVKRVPQNYAGEYIAYRSWQSNDIIAHSQNMAQVIKQAQEQGVIEPVVMFVPKHDMVYIY